MLLQIRSNQIKICFPTVCSVRISLVWALLGSVTLCDSPMKLPKNGQTSDILAEHTASASASNHMSIFQKSLPCLHLSFHNAFPCHLKCRRNLMYKKKTT